MNTALLLLLMHQLPLGLADPQQAGREALDHRWGGYPWYDSQADEVQRVDVTQPRDWSWLEDSSPQISFPGSLLQWLSWIAIILLLAGVAYLLVRALGYGEKRSAKSGHDDEPGDDADRVESLPLPVRGGRLDLLAEARRHYQQGNYRQAIIYLFGFQLVQLDKQQIIRLTKGKTNRQYLREVGPRKALQRLVEQTMVAFEDVFFGNHTLDRARFESCWSRLDEFQSLSAEGAGQ